MAITCSYHDSSTIYAKSCAHKLHDRYSAIVVHKFLQKMHISDPALFLSSLLVLDRSVTDSAANLSSLQLKEMLVRDPLAYLMFLQLYTLINTMRKDPRAVMDSFASKYLLLAQGGNDVGEAFAYLSSVLGKSRVVDEAFLSVRCVRDDGQAEESFVESVKVRAFACCTCQALFRENEQDSAASSLQIKISFCTLHALFKTHNFCLS